MLRETTWLQYVDYERKCIWLFDPRAHDEWPGDFDQDPDLQELQRYIFSRDSQGIFLAKDLVNHASKSASLSGAPGAGLRPEAAAASTNQALDEGMNTPSTASDARNPQVNSRIVYSSLISALLSQAARRFKETPGDITVGNGVHAIPVLNHPLHCRLVGLHIYLTTLGHVVYTPYTLLYRLRRLKDIDQLRLAGRPAFVHVLPLNILANPNIVPYDHDQDSMHDKVWKETVALWLRAKGIRILGLDAPEAWLRVSPLDRQTAANLASPASDDISHKDQGHSMLWPENLCFSIIQSSSKDLGSGEDEGTTFLATDHSSWFKSAQDGGFVDPFVSLQAWVQEKSGRDLALKQETSLGLANDESRRLNSGGAGPASSPIASRNAHELQAVAGMYPTPPDGMVSSIAAPSIDAIASSTPIPTKFDERQGSDGVMANIDLDQQNVPIVPDQSVEDDIASPTDYCEEKDDLFDFADEEEIVSLGITDADFNFFDEADEVLKDPTTGIQILSEPIAGIEVATLPVEPAEVSSDTEPPPISDDTAPFDGTVNSSSPMTGAEHNVDQASPQGLVQSPPTVHVVKDDRPPLSPESLRQALYILQDAELARHLPNQKKHPFAALMFAQGLREIDTKYHLSNDSRDQRSPPQENLALSSNFATLVLGALTRLDSGLKRKASAIDYDHDTSSTSDSTDYDDSLTELRSVQDPMDIDSNADLAMDLPRRDVAVDTSSNDRKSAMDRLIALARTGFGHLEPLLCGDLSLGRDTSLYESSLYQSAAPSCESISQSLPASPMSPGSQAGTRFSEKQISIVAQLVAEHVASSSLDLLGETSEPLGITSVPPESLDLSTGVVTSSGQIFTEYIENLGKYDLLGFAGLQDLAHEQSLAARLQPRQINRKAPPHLLDNSGPLTICLPSPHMRARRTDGIWDVLPSALPFWEPLGLLPAQGQKNISAFCLFPDNQDLRSQVIHFLDQLGNTYERCRLGEHRWAIRSESISDGLRPFRVNSSHSYDEVIASIQSACTSIGMHLASSDLKTGSSERVDTFNNGSVMVYVVNPLHSPRALRDICFAFCKLCHIYMRSGKPKLDIVLQVVPIKYIAAKGVPVFLGQSDLCRLAREVYDRCENTQLSPDTSRLRIPSTSCVQLEEVLMRKIDFRVAIDPPQDLLRENSNIHIAYAKRRGSQWMTVAWTTNSGKYDASAAYSLAGGRTFVDIAREVWQTTLDIISVRKVQWRVCIARAGNMEREEIDAWMSLAAAPSPMPIITLLTSVDANPPLELRSKTIDTTEGLFQTNSAAISGTTPAATPQPGISPDPTTVATPATPSTADPQLEAVTSDPDAHLVELADETWAIILGHRVNVSADCRDYRPSMSSGLLIRPAEAAQEMSSEDDSGMALTNESCLPMIMVHLLWVGSSTRGTGPIPQQHQTGMSPMNPSLQVAPGAVVGDSGSQAPAGASSASSASSNVPQQPPFLGNLPKSTSDGILKEYLQLYRNLALLAKIRGVRGSRNSCLPWHVAIAMRALAGLDAVMGPYHE